MNIFYNILLFINQLINYVFQIIAENFSEYIMLYLIKQETLISQTISQ